MNFKLNSSILSKYHAKVDRQISHNRLTNSTNINIDSDHAQKVIIESLTTILQTLIIYYGLLNMIYLCHRINQINNQIQR